LESHFWNAPAQKRPIYALELGLLRSAFPM
jgi:hypothetical protein